MGLAWYAMAQIVSVYPGGTSLYGREQSPLGSQPVNYPDVCMSPPDIRKASLRKEKGEFDNSF